MAGRWVPDSDPGGLMPRIKYVSKAFKPDSLAIIEQANVICAEYADQGFDLTLRQLYYQFVARGYIPNRQTEYKRLGSIVNDARLAGLLDWNYIVDRTRNLRSLAHWNTPEDILNAVSRQYRHELWEDQPTRVEVWIEKDALVGVIAGVSDRNDVPYFSCRGYTSQSEVWGAARRLMSYEREGQRTVVIHLGDHDPSGIDMTRDIGDRLALFGCKTKVVRIALTMAQVDQYQPPPNPAKMTDSRAEDYVANYGDDSWELDALDPATLDALIQAEIDTWRDADVWEGSVARQEYQRNLLVAVHERWDEVTALVDEDRD
jgi:hypothetical protein